MAVSRRLRPLVRRRGLVVRVGRRSHRADADLRSDLGQVAMLQQRSEEAGKHRPSLPNDLAVDGSSARSQLCGGSVVMLSEATEIDARLNEPRPYVRNMSVVSPA